ncbi:thioredoxin family protein [Pseudomonas syringae]|uniref:thioredoxin family protein n=1 Tax=Pseudomonas TaxID=286 RepID=UPI000D27785A|nr:thioredoxin [Pseudomonas syringae]POD18854.1 thioredoxin [Pseudomonas syringae pv. syringae]UQB19559.1 thioredoxin [Pseudomonas syringae pv. syringae]
MSVMTVTDSTFQKDVIEASNQRLVVVEFSTNGKVSKRGEENASARMDTIFNALEEKYAGKVSLVRVEIELDSHLKDSSNPVTSTQYQINHGPTMVFFKAGARAREYLVGH